MLCLLSRYWHPYLHIFLCRYFSLFFNMLQFPFISRGLPHVGQFLLPPSTLRHPVDMRTIHLKLPNEKPNEASLTERGFCEREREQDGRWPIVSNVISILVDGFPMWVSCTRASGCLQSYMIYSWLLGECPHTLTCTHTHIALIQKEAESEAERRVTHMLISGTLESIPSWQAPKQTLYAPNSPKQVFHPSLLCDSLRCQSVSVPLPCPPAQQLWCLPRTGRAHPADAPGITRSESRKGQVSGFHGSDATSVSEWTLGASGGSEL